VTSLRGAALLALLLSACASKGSASGASAVPASSAKGSDGAAPLSSVCVTSGPETCFDATDDNCNGVIDEGCGVETGPVQFAIAWELAKADVDLLVTDPSGELAEVGRSLGSGLTKQRDCPGRNDECRGKNLENVYLNGPEAPRGRYAVRIVLESLGGESPPVRVRFGARVGPRSFAEEFVLERTEAVREMTFGL
jgi:tRNA (guanosine-2'-O-)-methyltransferase